MAWVPPSDIKQELIDAFVSPFAVKDSGLTIGFDQLGGDLTLRNLKRAEFHGTTSGTDHYIGNSLPEEIGWYYFHINVTDANGNDNTIMKWMPARDLFELPIRNVTSWNGSCDTSLCEVEEGINAISLTGRFGYNDANNKWYIAWGTDGYFYMASDGTVNNTATIKIYRLRLPTRNTLELPKYFGEDNDILMLTTDIDGNYHPNWQHPADIPGIVTHGDYSNLEDHIQPYALIDHALSLNTVRMDDEITYRYLHSNQFTFEAVGSGGATINIPDAPDAGWLYFDLEFKIDNDDMNGKVTHTIKKWVNANQLHSLPQKDLLTWSPGCEVTRCTADGQNSIAINNQPFGARKANVYVGIRENSDGNTLFFASNDTQSNADLLVKVHQLQLPDAPPGGWEMRAPHWHMSTKYEVGDLVRRENELDNNLHRIYVAVADHTSTLHTTGTFTENQDEAWEDDSTNWRSLDNGYRGTWKEGSHYLKGDIAHQASLGIGQGFYVAVEDHIATTGNSPHATLGKQTTWRQLVSKGSEVTEVWTNGTNYYVGDIIRTNVNGELKIFRCIREHKSPPVVTFNTSPLFHRDWVELTQARDRGLYNKNLYYWQGDTVLTLSGDDNDVFNAFIARKDHLPTDNTHPLTGSLTLENWYHIGSADPPDVAAVEGLGDITKTWGTTTKFRKGDLVTLSLIHI